MWNVEEQSETIGVPQSFHLENLNEQKKKSRMERIKKQINETQINKSLRRRQSVKINKDGQIPIKKLNTLTSARSRDAKMSTTTIFTKERYDNIKDDRSKAIELSKTMNKFLSTFVSSFSKEEKIDPITGDKIS